MIQRDWKKIYFDLDCDSDKFIDTLVSYKYIDELRKRGIKI